MGIGGQYGVNLNTANSINWGRLVPQVAYHFHAYLQLVDQGRIKLGDQVDLAVPCGNMGNMVSALLARSMGLPFGKMIIACNSNNVLADFFRTGVYDLEGAQLACTISPAIDILVSSNLERWLCLQLGPERVAELYSDLATNKVFRLSDDERKLACPSYIEADWCSEGTARWRSSTASPPPTTSSTRTQQSLLLLHDVAELHRCQCWSCQRLTTPSSGTIWSRWFHSDKQR